MSNVLPDSRLKSLKGSVIAVIHGLRLELQPIYCFNCCIRKCGYVPVDIVDWVAWLCPYCSEQWGVEADKLAAPDHQFWRDVEAEILARFGKRVTQQELWQAGEQNRLGNALNLLSRDRIPSRKTIG